MTLQDWRRDKGGIENDIRSLMQKRRYPDTSREACQRWARDFIQAILPKWRPGMAFTHKQAQLIGRKFNYLLGRPDPKAPRQERMKPPKRKGKRK